MELIPSVFEDSNSTRPIRLQCRITTEMPMLYWVDPQHGTQEDKWMARNPRFLVGIASTDPDRSSVPSLTEKAAIENGPWKKSSKGEVSETVSNYLYVT